MHGQIHNKLITQYLLLSIHAMVSKKMKICQPDSHCHANKNPATGPKEQVRDKIDEPATQHQ
jgi:hypothetical protein